MDQNDVTMVEERENPEETSLTDFSESEVVMDQTTDGDCVNESEVTSGASDATQPQVCLVARHY